MPSKPSKPTQPARPPATGLRAAIERGSRPLLVRITRMPRAVPFVTLLVLLVVGIYVGGGVGVACTGVVALFVGWLMYLSWPALTSAERLGRGAVLLLAVALCVVQVFPPG